MPWVATDKDGSVWVYEKEPETTANGFMAKIPIRLIPAKEFPNAPAPGEKREFKWADVVASDATDRVNKDIERMVFRDILRELVSVQDGGHPPSRLNNVTERARRALASSPQTENEKIAKQIVDTQKQSEKMRCGRCGSTALTMEVFNFGKRFACKNCFAISGYNDKPDESSKKEPPGAVELAAMQEDIRERLQPGPIVRQISLAEFSDEDRPVPAACLVVLLRGLADEASHGRAGKMSDILSQFANSIERAAGLPQGVGEG